MPIIYYFLSFLFMHESADAEVEQSTTMMYEILIIMLEHCLGIHKKCVDLSGHLMDNILPVEEMTIYSAFGVMELILQIDH